MALKTPDLGTRRLVCIFLELGHLARLSTNNKLKDSSRSGNWWIEQLLPSGEIANPANGNAVFAASFSQMQIEYETLSPQSVP